MKNEHNNKKGKNYINTLGKNNAFSISLSAVATYVVQAQVQNGQAEIMSCVCTCKISFEAYWFVELRESSQVLKCVFVSPVR